MAEYDEVVVGEEVMVDGILGVVQEIGYVAGFPQARVLFDQGVHRFGLLGNEFWVRYEELEVV